MTGNGDFHMTSRLVLLAALLAPFACERSCFSASSPAGPPAPTTAPSTRPVAAVWYELSGMTVVKPGEKFEPNRLIVGVWSDGTVVWSSDRRTGGKPYWTGKIAPELVAKLLASLKTVGFFEPSKISGFGPDASITVLAAQADEKRQWLGSWHEPATTRPRVIVSEIGISAIAPGEPRPKPSAEYQRFLDIWAESRRLIESVVPEQSGVPLQALDEQVFQTGRDR